MDIRVEHRIVGTQHVFTSPDLPGLYVAHADKAVAESSVPEAVAMLRAMAARRAEKRQVDKLISLRA